MEEHAAAMEGQRVRLKEEESKWREALMESETRASFDMSQARASASSASGERDRQLRLEMQQAEEKQASAFLQVSQELAQVSGQLRVALEISSSDSVKWNIEFEKRRGQSEDIMKRFDAAKRNEMKVMMKNFKNQQKQDREKATAIHQTEISGLLSKIKEQEENIISTCKKSYDASQMKNNELMLLKDQEQEKLLLSKLKEQAVTMEAELTRGLKLEVYLIVT